MIRYDCRHYAGQKPCQHKRACPGCAHYDKVELRVLIIKLGALGDLLRTTPILPSLRARYPQSHITWLTQASCVPLLQNLGIDRIWTTDQHATARVLAQHFDVMICFDKDAPAPELATLSKADVKKGFGISQAGVLMALNPASQYALELGINDDLKFRQNTLTYQEIIHQMADLQLHGTCPDYQLRLTPTETAFGADWIQSQLHARDGKSVLGVNAGAGRVFATKKWLPERYAELLIRLHSERGVIPLLLGGTDETEQNDWLFKALRKKSIPVLRPGENLSLREFVSVVRQCDGFVTGDTLGMHIALAMKIPTVILFTSTCHQEIELYSTGRKIVGTASCAPCYLASCKQDRQHCSESITVDQVFDAVVEQMGLTQGENLRRHSHL